MLEISVSFHFHSSLRYFQKGFVKALKVFIKPFLGTTKNCENKDLSKFYFGISIFDDRGDVKS